jgi:DNA adenine methylase
LHELKIREEKKVNINIPAKPFLKWVGGKTQLLPELTTRIPQNFSRYFEPFMGGGALFFRLLPEQSILIDINEELTNTYKVIRDQTEELIIDLKQHVYEKDYYYQIRNIDRTDEYKSWSAVRRASRLIYLNKSCFNGLYRVNSKGEFNTPMGRYKNPKIVDETNLRACSKGLQKAQIITGSFLEVEKDAISEVSYGQLPGRENPSAVLPSNISASVAKITSFDFVYFDPPYAPLNATSNFTGYSRNGFDQDMHLCLRNLCSRLDARGIRFMVSNSSAPLILDLYQDYKIEFVYATRAINSKGHKRGKIPEVIITNY